MKRLVFAVTDDILANLERVRARINTACERAGRDPGSVRLLGVAKTKPAELIAIAVEAGLLDIGENYAQELLKKADLLPGHVRWHFIGRLQSKKVRRIVGRVALIHSVDRIKILNEIEKRAAAADIVVRCLLEINVGEEDTKGGVASEEARELLRAAADLPHVRVDGLMDLPPFLDDQEAIRPYHRRLRELAERLRDETGLALPDLSMGMSGDLEAAIEEGATIVRIGTDIFGYRSCRRE